MSRAAQSLFPHQKLDWTISRLQERVDATPDDPTARIELAGAMVSRGLYHGGGEQVCNDALAHVRRALTDDPANVHGLVVAALALCGMDRPRAAARYLDQAVRVDGELPLLRLAMGKMEGLRGEYGQAVRQLETACRLAPDAWETHLELGRALMSLAREERNPPRLVERAQYHLVQTLQREPSTERVPEVIRDLGIVCMQTGRHREAERFFGRLKQHDKYRASAHLHLGEVSFQLGKYNNAIQHLRQYLRKHPDNPDVLAKVALCWFHLEEYGRARETCHQALMADPDHVEARYALGCALIEEGVPNEAMKVFREALKEQPGHMASYAEMVRARRLSGDIRWIQQALQAEVANHDRLAPGGSADPRAVTRERVHVVLDEIRQVGDEMVPAVLGAIAHTQDEGLRFLLWEAASELAVGTVANAATERLQRSSELYGPGLGGLALAAAAAIPEPSLVSGLRLEEADLKRAAVDRHAPAHDVQAHRENLKTERDRARAHQALLLLAIGQRRSPSAMELLRRWADAADPELATAAWAALVMSGDPEASARLQTRAEQQGHEPLVRRLLDAVSPPAETLAPRKVSGDSETTCTTCGRSHGEVTHMIAGGNVVVCDRCVVHVTSHRASLSAPDDASCGLCGRTHFESAGLYHYNGVDICNSCIQLSLGLLEREEIERFLQQWGTR